MSSVVRHRLANPRGPAPGFPAPVLAQGEHDVASGGIESNPHASECLSLLEVLGPVSLAPVVLEVVDAPVGEIERVGLLVPVRPQVTARIVVVDHRAGAGPRAGVDPEREPAAVDVGGDLADAAREPVGVCDQVATAIAFVVLPAVVDDDMAVAGGPQSGFRDHVGGGPDTFGGQAAAAECVPGIPATGRSRSQPGVRGRRPQRSGQVGGQGVLGAHRPAFRWPSVASATNGTGAAQPLSR
jgi:hypothetical protein